MRPPYPASKFQASATVNSVKASTSSRCTANVANQGTAAAAIATNSSITQAALRTGMQFDAVKACLSDCACGIVITQPPQTGPGAPPEPHSETRTVRQTA